MAGGKGACCAAKAKAAGKRMPKKQDEQVGSASHRPQGYLCNPPARPVIVAALSAVGLYRRDREGHISGS